MEIMNTFASLSRAVFLLPLVLASTAGNALAAPTVLQKVPALTVEQTTAYPENLARHQLGARLEAVNSKPVDAKSPEARLLSNDPIASYPVPAGTTTLLVALPKIENVGSISFVNKGVKGSVAVATSNAKLPNDSPQWHTALSQDLVPNSLRANIGPSEAKYVRLTFSVTEPGEIAGFGIYASPRVSDFTASRGRKTDESASFGLVSYNYTDMHAKARALYVSSGSDLKQANNMIDDQTATTYPFAAEDGSPTTVIDLGKSVTLRRLSAVYSPKAGSMSFYVLPNLPGGGGNAGSLENAPKTITLDDAAFANLKAIASTTDDGNQGRAAVEFPATTGRYLMVRWTPGVQQDSSFSLAEVAAFGSQNNTLLAANDTTGGDQNLEETEGSTESSDGKTMLDGKTMIDAKDSPAEEPIGEGPPGEGPNLPHPPPFTFVPFIVPNSP